ncbi:MAG: 6-phosphogluconolactonase [Candidatus Fimadaptatus sp.]
MIVPNECSFSVKRYATRGMMGRAAARDAAQIMRDMLSVKPAINVIFAAAPSQNEVLAALLEQDVDFTRIRAFHMDEYVGLEPGAPQSFGEYLREHIFGRARFMEVNYIDGRAADIDAECARYAALLRKYPPDVVMMGIGENGHIAFNDPHEADLSDPRAVKRVELDEVCRMQQVHDGCFASLADVPRYAITLTVPTLTQAAAQICVVPAAAKAAAVRAAVCGPIGSECPASALRLCRDARMYLDADSAALIESV